MAYTATKYLTVVPYSYPTGQDYTQRLVYLRGQLFDCDTATMYSVGGIGSTSFEVTAFSAAGLVTFSALTGLPLVNGQLVVIYNTASNTNDGTYTVNNISYSSTTAGTFTAAPIGLNALSGTAQTSQTAEGVGQIQWGNRTLLQQTLTISAVSAASGITTATYTTLVGPQIKPGQTVTLPLSSGTAQYTVIQVTQTSSTGGKFTVADASASVTTGSATGGFNPGTDAALVNATPAQVRVSGSNGYVYVWNATNQTIQVWLTGTASGDPLNEAGLGATVAFDSTITFEAVFQAVK